jgi:transposase
LHGTMTWVGLDVHARSTHAAAIHALTGELERMRFGPGAEPVVAWLAGLPGPVRAAYEAGPTGFGLKRAADAVGVQMQVVAPGKTPRAAADRVKTDRKDAELLARLRCWPGNCGRCTSPTAGSNRCGTSRGAASKSALT